MEVESQGMKDSLLTPGDNEDEERQPKSVKSVQPKSASFSLWLGPFFYRNPKRFTWPEWVFLAVSAATIIAALILNIRSVVYFAQYENALEENPSLNGSFCTNTSSTGFVFSCQSDLVLAVVVLANILFVTYYVVDGLLREHQFELLAYILAVLGIAVYVVINYGLQATRSTDRLIEPWRLARLVITLVLSPVSIFLAAVVFHKMGALQFDALGASPTLLRAYKWTRALSALMKLHFEVFLTLFLMVVTRVPLGTAPLTPHPAELAFLCALFLSNLVAWVASSVGTYLEWKLLSISSLILMTVTALYYVFRIVWTSVRWSKSTEAVNPHNVFDSTAVIAIVILLLCAGGLVLVVLSIPLSIKVILNYGKGLKDKLLR